MSIRLVRLAAAVLVLGAGHRLFAVDFLRGDANGDGTVSISDSHRIASYLFRGLLPSDCIKTMDLNGDDSVNVTDSIYGLNYLFLGGPVPPAPFPQPGPDSGGGGGASELTCESYGMEPPLDDPKAKIEILDAVAPGGVMGEVVITLALSSSSDLAGYSARILVDTTVVAALSRGAHVKDLTGTEGQWSWNLADLAQGRLDVSFLNSLPWNSVAIPAGEDVEAMQVTLCLAEGTRSGEYPLSLASGELTDYATGKAIAPVLVSGTLTILEDLAPRTGCVNGDCASPPPPPGGLPADLHTQFEIRGAKAKPGGSVRLPMFIRADATVQGFAFSVDFDETVLQAMPIETVYERPNHGPYDFASLQINNSNDVPGSGGVDEGFLFGAVVFSFTDNCSSLPANRDNETLAFHFTVAPETDATVTDVRFLDGAGFPGEPPVRNFLSALSQAWYPETADSFVLIDGFVDILPEISTFVRGDSDGNGQVSIADAQQTLGYLFAGSGAPICLDGADADDNGNLDISDPIYTLRFLFLGGPVLPAPYPEAGVDPTDDPMTCSGLIQG